MKNENQRYLLNVLEECFQYSRDGVDSIFILSYHISKELSLKNGADDKFYLFLSFFYYFIFFVRFIYANLSKLALIIKFLFYL